jgi:hypothetical protein
VLVVLVIRYCLGFNPGLVRAMFLFFLFLGFCCALDPRICPLDEDIAAARIIDAEINPVLQSHRLTAPLSCPFHPAHDRMLLVRQSRLIAPGRVRCAFCQKEVETKEMMSEHLIEHYNKIVSSSTRCYSDYCSVLGCVPAKESESKSLLHKCRELVNLCVPDQKHPANEVLKTRLCSKFGGVVVEKEESSARVLKGTYFFVFVFVLFDCLFSSGACVCRLLCCSVLFVSVSVASRSFFF